ncbi:MAG: DUF3892 domain-containing protein [Candidatus Dormibacteria bacterium]|jgi:hypothetical protein
MTVYVTAISPSTARQHEHIGEIRWLDSSHSTSNTMSMARSIAWLREGNKLFVAGDKGPAEVRVVDATPPHLRTVADGNYTDNLLALPRY